MMFNVNNLSYVNYPTPRKKFVFFFNPFACLHIASKKIEQSVQPQRRISGSAHRSIPFSCELT